MRRGSGRGQGGGHLATNMMGLALPGDDHAALGGEQEVDSPGKARAKLFRSQIEGIGLGLEDFTPDFKVGFG